MTDVQLTCNLSSCRKKLTKQAWVTSCSHIFCSEHMQSMVGHDNHSGCLACGTQLRNELDFVHADLNPTDQYKAMVLTGLNPDQIMEIATRAIGFFAYQLNYNNQNKESLLKHTKEQNNEMKHYCASLTAKFKADLQKEQRKAENLKRELEEKIREIEMQQQHIAQYKRANKKLQTQLDSHKREIVNMRTTPISGNRSPFVANSYSGRNSNFQPRLQEPVDSQHFYPEHNSYQNVAFGNPAQFVSPFKSYERFSH